MQNGNVASNTQFNNSNTNQRINNLNNTMQNNAKTTTQTNTTSTIGTQRNTSNNQTNNNVNRTMNVDNNDIINTNKENDNQVLNNKNQTNDNLNNQNNTNTTTKVVPNNQNIKQNYVQPTNSVSTKNTNLMMLDNGTLPLDKPVDETIENVKEEIQQIDAKKEKPVVIDEKASANDRPQVRQTPKEALKIKNSNFPNTNPLINNQ